jgi:hypothetical protein
MARFRKHPHFLINIAIQSVHWIYISMNKTSVYVTFSYPATFSFTSFEPFLFSTESHAQFCKKRVSFYSRMAKMFLNQHLFGYISTFCCYMAKQTEHF